MTEDERVEDLRIRAELKATQARIYNKLKELNMCEGEDIEWLIS